MIDNSHRVSVCITRIVNPRFMHSSAFDRLAAQNLRVRTILNVSWGLAGMAATLGGVLLGGTLGFQLGLSHVGLLAIPAAVRDYGRSRLVTGAALAAFVVAVVNLAHFSQGWVQFGYRFSNDYVPYLLLLVALGMARLLDRPRGRLLVMALVGVSVAINFWGTWWGMKLGW